MRENNPVLGSLSLSTSKPSPNLSGPNLDSMEELEPNGEYAFWREVAEAISLSGAVCTATLCVSKLTVSKAEPVSELSLSAAVKSIDSLCFGAAGSFGASSTGTG